MIITEKIFDVQTGETTIVEREATPEEVARRQADEAEALAAAEAFAAFETARQAAEAKLEALGLSTDDLRALGL
jgi:hypothetical protein